MHSIISAYLVSDKMVKQAEKRERADRIAGFYRAIGENSNADRCLLCGKFLSFEAYKDGSIRLAKASFCHLRLCPQCNWLLSIRRTVDLFKCLEEPEHKNKRFIFLTLTVKNCKADKLGETLDAMYEGLRSWTVQKNSFLRRRSVGMVKKLEITYNKRRQEFHPHFHILMEVEKEYFKNPKLYVSTKGYQEKWRETMGLSYEPVCHVEAVKDGDYNGLKETAKYSAKDADYGISIEVFRTFYKALKGRRLYTPQGTIKDTMKRLKMNCDTFDDTEKEVEMNCNPVVLKFSLFWSSGLKQYKVKVDRESNTDKIAGLALAGGEG